ncbi:hypothetical protein M0Q97_06695 [Candidatus Dojkabacteria bacterium]|jgi:hypothetical protein|nr:hypothetical protein [Candidatus Dojkabacteria bacterium]
MRIKTYKEFKESFTITLDQLPSIGDIVDKVDWKDGQKVAFIDFKGIRNIPIHILDKDEQEQEQE